MTLSQEHVEYVATTIDQMIRLLGLEANVSGEENDGTVVISIETPDAGRLIGRKGRTLENIEYLLNRIVSQKYESFARIRLDVSGYQREGEEAPAQEPTSPPPPAPEREDKPERRERDEKPQRRERPERPQKNASGETRKLESLARDVAKEVKRWGEPKRIGPLGAGEREIVINMLKNDPDVRTDVGEESGGKAEITVTTAESEEA